MFPEQNHSVIVHNSPLNQSSSQSQFGFTQVPKVVYETQYNQPNFEGPQLRRSNSIGFENRVNMSPRNHHSPDRCQRTTYYELSPSKRNNMVCGENYTTITTFPQNMNHNTGQVHTIVHSPQKNYYSMRGREGFTEIYEVNDYPSNSRCEIKHPMNREIYSNVRPLSPRNYSTRPEHIYVNKENMHFPHNMDMNNSDSYRFKRDMREVYEDRRGINGSYTQYP